MAQLVGFLLEEDGDFKRGDVVNVEVFGLGDDAMPDLLPDVVYRIPWSLFSLTAGSFAFLGYWIGWWIAT